MFRRASGFNPEREGRAEALSTAESRLFERLVPARNREAIQIDDPAFGFYDPQKRAKDKQRVKDEKRDFERKNAGDPSAEMAVARGKLFEAIIEDQIMSSDWMGPYASVIVPSEYDDYVNFVDTIIEFDRPGQLSHLALGIDVTSNSRKVGEKFAGIKKSIEQGTLSLVEYFKSAHLTGRIDRVPQVIVGADAKTRTEVAELLLQYKTLKDSTDDSPARHEQFKKVRATLEHHPLQFKILYLIREQLVAFSSYARKMGNQEAASIYDNARTIISEILRLKEAPESKDDFEYEDEVYGLLLQYTRELARSAKN